METSGMYFFPDGAAMSAKVRAVIDFAVKHLSVVGGE